MKRNSWKRLLAIMGAASILTVSINPVRINAGGSDLPIVSAEVNAEASTDNTETTSSEIPGTQTETQTETASNTEASPSSSDAADSVPASDNHSSDSNTQEDTTGSDDADDAALSGDSASAAAEASTSEQTTDDTADGSDAAGTDASSASSDEKTGESGTEKSTADASTKSSEEADTEDTKADETDKKAGTRITVKYQSADKTMGSVTLSEEEGKAEEDSEEVTFQGSTAKPNEGYEFVDWTLEQDGEMVEVSTDVVFVPTDVTEDTTYFANFEKEKESKTITVTYAAGEGGKVSPDSESFQTGSESEIQLTGSTAVANEGYTFLGWVKGEGSGKDRTYVSTDAAFVPDTSAITEDTTYTAVFEKKEEKKTAEVDLADYVDGLKVYYRTSSDDPWTEAVITGEEVTCIPQTAELKFDFTLSRLTKAGDYTYEIPEFLTDASLEDLEDGAFTSEDAEVTSAAEITSTGSDAEDSDTADTSKLVLHLNKEDAAKELTGAHLTFTAAPNTDKLTTAADRTRTLTFGDRTYTLTFAAVRHAKMMLASAERGKLILSDDANKNYITGAQVAYQNGGDWVTITDQNENIPMNANYRITVNYSGISSRELSEKNIYYKLNDGLKDATVTSGIIMDGTTKAGNISVKKDENGTNWLVLSYDDSYLDKSIDAHINNASFMFYATVDPSKVNDYRLTLKFGDAEITLNFDKDSDIKNGSMTIDKSEPKIFSDAAGNYYLEYSIKVTAVDVDIPEGYVEDSFTKNPNGAVVSYYINSGRPELPSTGDGSGYPFETASENIKDSTAGTISVDTAKGTPGTMKWTFHSLKKGEWRQLTYRVKLNSDYIGRAAGSSDVITNSATVYAKGNTDQYYKKGTDTANFTQNLKASVDKTASAVTYDSRTGTFYIDYTITVSAPKTNSLPLENLKISDTLSAVKAVSGRSDSAISDKTLRESIEGTYSKDGSDSDGKQLGFSDFKIINVVNSNDGSPTDVTKETDSNGNVNDAYYVLKTDSEASGFNLYIHSLPAGTTKKITYRLTFSPLLLDQVSTDANGSLKLNNRAAIHTDDSDPTYGNRFLAVDNTSTSFGYQYWDRKIQGEAIPEAIDQQPKTDVFVPSATNDETASSWKQAADSGISEITVPSGAYKYTVVVNEKGEWNLSSSAFADVLSENGKYMRYAGYLQVDYYANGIPDDIGSGTANDNAAAEKLRNTGSPTATYYLNVDGLKSFTFTPKNLSTDEATIEKLGLGSKGAYILTYYAVQVGSSNYTKVTAGNSFTLSGVGVGPGGTRVTIPGMKVSTSVVLTGDASTSAKKTGWYYEYADNPADKEYGQGKLYWVIEISGSEIPAGTMYTDKIVGRTHAFRGTSFVGAYLGSAPNGAELTEYYSSIDSLTASNGFTQLDTMKKVTNDQSGSYPQTIVIDNYVATIRFRDSLKLDDGESLYIVLASAPTVTWDNRTIMTFQNDLFSSDGSKDELRINPATISSLRQGSNFKEFGESGTYDGNTWSNVLQQTEKGNEPGNKILTAYTTGSAEQNLQPGTYIDYRLVVNYAGDMEGTYQVEDLLPAGTEAVYVRDFWIPNGDPNNSYNIRNNDSLRPKTDELILSDDWIDIGLKNAPFDGAKNSTNSYDRDSVYAYYNKTENKIKIEVFNLHKNKEGLADNNSADKRDIQLQVVLCVTDPTLLMGYNTESGDAKIGNTMTVSGDSGELARSTAYAKLKTASISKTYQKANESTTTGSTSSTTTTTDSKILTISNGLPGVLFTITVNPNGEDLLAQADTLTLIDKMTGDLTLNPSSIHVKNANGEDEIYQVSYGTSQNDNQAKVTTMNLVIPDNKKLTITYFAYITATLNSTVTFSNTAYWFGYEKSASSIENQRFFFDADATASQTTTPNITIVKADQQNVSKFLQGATFSIYEAKYSEENKKWEIPEGTSPIDTGTTGTDGKLTFSGRTNSSITFNKVYGIKETNAPEGYLVADPIFVSVTRSVNGLYPYKNYDWNSSNAKADDTNSWTEAQVNAWLNQGVDVRFTTADPEFTVYDSRAVIEVNKTFYDSDNKQLTGDAIPDGTYVFGLFHSNTKPSGSDTPIEKLEITYQGGNASYLLTTYQDDNPLTEQLSKPQFVNLNIGDNYWIYELNVDGEPIANGTIFYNQAGRRFKVDYGKETETNPVNMFTAAENNNAFAVGNYETIVPKTGVASIPMLPYVGVSALLSGVFVAYVLWHRKKRQ